MQGIPFLARPTGIVPPASPTQPQGVGSGAVAACLPPLCISFHPLIVPHPTSPAACLTADHGIWVTCMMGWPSADTMCETLDFVSKKKEGNIENPPPPTPTTASTGEWCPSRRQHSLCMGIGGRGVPSALQPPLVTGIVCIPCLVDPRDGGGDGAASLALHAPPWDPAAPQGGTGQKRLPTPCTLGGQEATLPVPPQGSLLLTTGKQSEVATQHMPSWGPTSGQSGYMTHAMSWGPGCNIFSW